MKMLFGFLQGVMNRMNNSSGSTTCFFSPSFASLPFGFFAAKTAVSALALEEAAPEKAMFLDAARELASGRTCGENATTAEGPTRERAATRNAAITYLCRQFMVSKKFYVATRPK